MWSLVKEGLRFYRPVLLTAWTICTVGIACVFAILTLFGIVSPRHAPLWAASVWPFYMLLASAVPGWIALGTEITEHRLRLHLTLALSFRQVAVAQLLLPVALLACGLPLSHGVAALVRLTPEAPIGWLRHGHIDLIAAHLLCLHQLSFAMREVALLRERSRWWVALGALVLMVLINVELWVGIPIRSVYSRVALVTVLALVTAVLTLTLFLHRRQLAR